MGRPAKTLPGRKTRLHKVRQLVNRPLTLEVCRGEVTIGAMIRDGVPIVHVSFPADVPVSQPDSALDKPA